MKKNKKFKKKLAYGDLLEAKQQDAQVDQMGTQVAGSIPFLGPLWGALAKAGTTASKQVKGDGTDYGDNLKGTAIDPFSWAKNNNDAGDWAASALLGPANWGSKARKQKKQAEEMRSIENAAVQNASFKPTFNMGGRSGKQRCVDGGTLEPISEDAVEVKATNPGLTDSVELETAFVDNNEIIDNQNRVFSDDLTTPNGRSIAKEAKRLEKMKSPNPRFDGANSHIDSKLTELFDYQTRLNQARQSSTQVAKTRRPVDQIDTLGEAVDAKVKMRSFKEDMGDNIERVPLNEQLDGLDDRLAKKRAHAEKYLSKYKFKKGGKLTDPAKPLLDESALYGGQTQIELDNPPQAASPFGEKQQEPMKFNTWDDAPTDKNRFDWRKAGNTAATYGSDIFNAYLTSQLPKPKTPSFERTRKLNRVSPNSQLAENSRLTTNLARQIGKSTSQASISSSIAGSLLSKRLSADNQVRNETNRLNAYIDSNEAGMNQSVDARNTERMNSFKAQQLERRNRQLSGYSQVASNVSNKVQMQNRERNLQDLSLAELEVLKKAYGDSGVYDRNFQSILDDLMKKQGTKRRFGGRL